MVVMNDTKVFYQGSSWKGGSKEKQVQQTMIGDGPSPTEWCDACEINAVEEQCDVALDFSHEYKFKMHAVNAVGPGPYAESCIS